MAVAGHLIQTSSAPALLEVDLMAPSIPIEFTGQKESKKYLLSEMVKSRKYSKAHSSGFVPDSRYAVETMGESEGLGSFGHIDAQIAASEDSSAPKRKCISLNSDGYENFGVPLHVLSLSKMSRCEREDLQLRLKMELERIQILQRRVASYNSNTVLLSPSSDIRSSSDGLKRPLFENAHRSSEILVPHRKYGPPPSRNESLLRKSTSGRFESVKPAVGVNTSNAVLMKQCGSLLNRLMSHQFGWVFNTPVDVVKLNVPDYFNVIKHPMDLGRIKSKISAGEYLSPLGFADDVRLTFSNAMTYNPPGNNVHIMADTLRKQFEMRWKAIQKKLPVATDVPSVPSRADVHMENETMTGIPPSKKKKVRPSDNEVRAEPVGRIMTDEAKHNLSRELEALLSELPESIINFLKEHSFNECQNGEDEIEVDLDALSDDILFTLRNLLDDHLLEKRKSEAKNAEPGQMELVQESGLGNTSRQPLKDSVSGSSLDSKLDEVKDAIPVIVSKEKENLTSGAYLEQSIEPVNEFGEVDLHSQGKPVTAEPYSLQEGESVPSERLVSPEKLYRAALLRNRFADVILKAREKAFEKGDKQDPEKLQIEREELERRQKEEKARLQAEAIAAEEARRKAEAEAAVEAKRKRELEREAARQALQKMEKTVDINENSQFMEDLEMLRASHGEDLTGFMDEMSPDLSQNKFGSFKLQGSNPLEQLGLYMKDEEEEDEIEPPPNLPDPVNDVEDGEVD